MGQAKNIGKTLAMLILIVIMVLGGLMWFDYLGLINAKSFFMPVYSLFGLDPQTSVSNTQADLSLTANLEDDRFAKRLEALTIRNEEQNQREANILLAEAQNVQIAQELEEMRIALEEQQITFNNEVKKYDDRSVNIEQNARDLASMRPDAVVGILNAMDDQDIIDTLRMVNEIAALEGESSQASYWLSLMPAERVAELQRKMTSKPISID